MMHELNSQPGLVVNESKRTSDSLQKSEVMLFALFRFILLKHLNEAAERCSKFKG